MKNFFPYFLLLVGLMLFMLGCEGTVSDRTGTALPTAAAPAPDASDKTWTRQTFNFPIRPLVSFDGKVFIAQGGANPYRTIYESTDASNWKDTGVNDKITSTPVPASQYYLKDLSSYAKNPALPFLKVYAYLGESYIWDSSQIYKRLAEKSWNAEVLPNYSNIDFGAVGTYDSVAKNIQGPYYSKKKRSAVAAFLQYAVDVTFAQPATTDIPSGYVYKGTEPFSVKMLGSNVFAVVKQKLEIPRKPPLPAVPTDPQTDLYVTDNGPSGVTFNRVSLLSRDNNGKVVGEVSNRAGDSEIRLLQEKENGNSFYQLAVQTSLSVQGPTKAPIRLYRGDSDLINTSWAEIPALSDLFKAKTGVYAWNLTLEDFQFLNGAYVLLVNQDRGGPNTGCYIVTSTDLTTFKIGGYKSTYCFATYSVGNKTVVMAEEKGLVGGAAKFQLAVIPVIP